MTIDEAIKILSESASFIFTRFDPKLKEAQKLGIEALKAVKESRKDWVYTVPKLLPGETE